MPVTCHRRRRYITVAIVVTPAYPLEEGASVVHNPVTQRLHVCSTTSSAPRLASVCRGRVFAEADSAFDAMQRQSLVTTSAVDTPAQRTSATINGTTTATQTSRSERRQAMDSYAQRLPTHSRRQRDWVDVDELSVGDSVAAVVKTLWCVNGDGDRGSAACCCLSALCVGNGRPRVDGNEDARR